MGDGMFTRLGRLFDKGLDKGTDAAFSSLIQIHHAVGLDPAQAAVSSGISKLADGLGAHEFAEYEKGVAALLRSDVNRAHMTDELTRLSAKTHAAFEHPVSIELSPTPSQPSTSKTEKEKTAEMQLFLKQAGYGDLLTRHGEGNGGVDGSMGRDTIAAENQYRKDHHLAANEYIRGGESVHGAPAAPVTPAVPKGSKLLQV